MKHVFTRIIAAFAFFAVALAPVTASAATTIVTPTNMDGWAEDSTPPSDVEFVNGPGNPPLGTGSAQFSVDATGASDAELRNSEYAGKKLADLTELSYWTYVQNNQSEQAVYIILNVDTNNDGTADDLLFFEPVYQDSSFCTPDQGDVVLNTWQEWNALTGCWHLAGGPSATDPLFHLNEYIANNPDATIVNGTGPTKGGVRLVAGFGGPTDWGSFLGNTDAFKIGFGSESDTYNFELVNVPTSKDQCKNGGWQSFNSPQGPFKNQGDCVSYVSTSGKNPPNGS